MNDAKDDYLAKYHEAEAMRPPNRITECALPIQMGIARSWPFDKRPADGWWYALLDCPPIHKVWDCSHDHVDPDDAWRCAETALRLVVEGKDPGDYSW